MDTEQEVYEVDGIWSEEWFSQQDRERFATLVKMIPSDVESLIDVGCGNGMFLNCVNEFRSNMILEGCDRSSRALESVRFRKKQCDISALGYESRSFDLVSCQEVIEHLPREVFSSGITNLAELSRKYILISVPYKEELVLNQVVCPFCSTRFHPDYHMQSFNETVMRKLIPGFKCTALSRIGEYWESLHFSLLKRFRENPFPNFTICPMCRFNRNLELKLASKAIAEKQTLVKNRPWWKFVIPQRRRFHWIAAVYERDR